MADLLDTLASARSALLNIPNGPPVVLRGSPDPEGEEVIVLDRVSDTSLPSYGRRATRKLIQVSCYAGTLARALELTSQARTALDRVGLRFVQSRPAPDGVGEISDYRS